MRALILKVGEVNDMFEMSIILICILTLFLLKIFLNVNLKKMKKFEAKASEELENLSNKFPKDEQICNEILEKLDNNDVKVKIEPEYNSCLYTVFNNTITIGKFQQNYMKIQTIAHECIHSSQNKRGLWSNFIFTNIYLIYFVVILILALFNKLPYTNIHAIILIFLSIIQYVIRFSLENEAMIKAKFVAKEYIEEKKILNKDEKNKLLEEYDRVNEIGIPFMNYYLISMNVIKIMIFSFIALA